MSFSAFARISLATVLLALATGSGVMAQAEFDEPFRPQFHFTPPAWWMNDPNGLELYTIGGDSRLHSLSVWSLAGIWNRTD